MSRYFVFVGARARRELAIALAWWRDHRPLAPLLLDEEFVGALLFLSDTPDAGGKFGAKLRRVLLPRTRYHVYYRIRPRLHRVDVIAVWHASRQPPPPRQ